MYPVNRTSVFNKVKDLLLELCIPSLPDHYYLVPSLIAAVLPLASPPKAAILWLCPLPLVRLKTVRETCFMI